MGPEQEVPAGSVALKQRTFLGHPVGLYILFFTEMWERFSYYGMRGLLTLYMANGLLWEQSKSSQVYKWYTSLVYLTPLLGGFMADRYLGNKRAVVIGAVLMAIGHFLMVFEREAIFYAALVFLIFGNGFFKPNMSTQVGRLYPPNDARRDGAYTIFYMGINLGAFLAPLICGWLEQNTEGGYHTGFAMAGIGMVIGLVTYLVGLRWVQELPTETSSTVSPEPPPLVVRDGGPSPETIRVVDTSVHRVEATLPEGAQDPSLSPGGGEATGAQHPAHPPVAGPLSEAVAERTPSTLPVLSKLVPAIFLWGSIVLAIAAPVLWFAGFIDLDTLIGLEIAVVCGFISAWIISQTHQAIRDRVLTIYVLGLFVVFFWAAFEQAGNAMNLWADKTTNRYLSDPDKPPPLFKAPSGPTKSAGAGDSVRPSFLTNLTRMFQLKPAAKPGDSGSWWSAFNPVPTAWFQSINPLGIFILAPLFAFLWTYLDRRKLNPSIPVKMAIGVLLQALAFALMIGAARIEDQASSVVLASPKLPAGLEVRADNQIYAPALEDDLTTGEVKRLQAGRLTWNAADHSLHLRGVLSDLDRDKILRASTPNEFFEKVRDLWKQSEKATGDAVNVSVELDKEPPGMDLRYSGFNDAALHYDPERRKLIATVHLAEKDAKAILVAGSDPQLREALNTLMVESSKFRVSLWWLFWFYVISTLGELCLSPVGLSMVSKLAPAKFATMLMGLWLLTSFFGNFIAGALGETWGSVPPEQYFLFIVVALGAASVLLLVLVRKIAKMMHGVT